MLETVFAVQTNGQVFLETVLALFAVGTLWFWLLLIGSSIAIVAFLENEKAWAATLTFVLTVTASIGLGNLGFLGWVLDNPGKLILAIVTYFVAGTIYGCVKWWLFVTNIKEKYIEQRDHFIEEMGEALEKFKVDPNHRDFQPCLKKRLEDETFINDLQQTVATGKLTGKVVSYWRECVKKYDEKCKRSKGYDTVPDYKKRITMPLVRNHKGRIIAWMSYWPWSLFWTILNDPIRRLFRRIYYKIKSFLQGISEKVFKDINEELAESHPAACTCDDCKPEEKKE